MDSKTAEEKKLKLLEDICGATDCKCGHALYDHMTVGPYNNCLKCKCEGFEAKY